MPPHRVGGLARARQLVDSARCVTVLTGAGISTDSGIPDFRGPQGVWTKDPAAERLSTLRAYLDDPEVRRHAWRVRLASPAWTARPNAGHRALVDLERSGKLDVLVTQNIDGLHQLAGNEPGRVIEIHGTLRDVVCLSCGDRGPTEPTLARVRAGEEDPACLRCGGILKSATISFGQSLVEADLARAEAAARRCDLLVAAGTSLAVYPAAGLVPLAVAHGAALIVANAEPTPFDRMADAVVREPLSEALPSILGTPPAASASLAVDPVRTSAGGPGPPHPHEQPAATTARPGPTRAPDTGPDLRCHGAPAPARQGTIPTTTRGATPWPRPS
jgi:NAD-dependent deacetylase